MDHNGSSKGVQNRSDIRAFGWYPFVVGCSIPRNMRSDNNKDCAWVSSRREVEGHTDWYGLKVVRMFFSRDPPSCTDPLNEEELRRLRVSAADIQ